MNFSRTIMVCVAALAGVGLGAATAAEAQVCRHIGTWSLNDGHWVCSGDYVAGHCVWYDDCRVNVD